MKRYIFLFIFFLIFCVSSTVQRFIFNNIYFFCCAGCIALAIYISIFLKPHPADKEIRAYKKGEITRQVAIERVAETMYSPQKEGIPPIYKSKIIENRLQALRKRVRAETDFMNDLTNYLKTKSRMK